uniref:Tigger transposable element-derived protein 1-like n=1 Tax=Geotrypetes seraphini TaxID=260995 RepID=A0A6P8RCY3_GEOSA|nr:tigger transposable element-derived protein 1-like [Geotrypetes seraphini]
MTTKRKLSLSTPQPSKKERKAIDLDTKMMIIKQYEGGKKVNAIACDLKLSHSTVSIIIKDKNRICEAVKGSAPLRSTVITKQCTGPFHEMEKLLNIWMEDQIQKQTPLSLFIVQSKARSLFGTLKKCAGEDYSQEFVASTGWFKRFKNRFQLHNVWVTGEAASADEEGAKKFVDSLEEIIKVEGYLAEQIFNMDETGLYWKQMPGCTYIHKEAKTMPGFKALKDRLTLLLGGNINGFKLKPLLIYHSENPRAFKNVNKHTLPVYYRSSRNAWMNQALFEDWYSNCFIPQVHEYCLEKGIPLLDNMPGHPHHLADLYPNVKVLFLPPNTIPLIQLMDQGAIATSKANYLRTTFAQAIAAIDADSKLSLHDYWKHEQELDEICEEIVKLSKDLSLECEMENVEELLDRESGELTNEELIELEEERVAEEKIRELEKEQEDEAPQRMFTSKGLSEGLSLLNKLLTHFEDMDSNMERFARIEQMARDTFHPYYEIYEEKK